jgi:hypothetical protein
MSIDERLASLKAVLSGQMELLRLCLKIINDGSIEYQGERTVCSLSEPKVKTSTLVAMAAGQSVNTILKFAEWRGIPVRDLYPVAGCALESFINAAYLVAEDDAVAERAIRYVAFAAYRQHNRKVGSGKFSLDVSTQPKASTEEESRFAEFKGKSSWTSLDAASRMNKVGQLAGNKAGSRLLAGYALLYSISSEIIHGSPFGVNYFFQAHLSSGSEGDVEAFREATARHVEDILIALIHGLAGYLSAFFTFQGMESLNRAEQSLFNTYLVLEGIDPQVH